MRVCCAATSVSACNICTTLLYTYVIEALFKFLYLDQAPADPTLAIISSEGCRYDRIILKAPVAFIQITASYTCN